jgi:hypothetical protein
MSLQESSNKAATENETAPSVPGGASARDLAAAAPDFTVPPKPISELVTDPDFPRCALGAHVDIGGITGVVVDIVKHSIRMRLLQGNTMSYNVNTLKKLYGPPPPQAPEPEPVAVAAEEPKTAAPPRRVITNPNFDGPVKPIDEFVDRPDFPEVAYGEHIDLRGYVGVVVEIVNRSLKVRSREGATRSYNADGLRKLYGKRPANS